MTEFTSFSIHVSEWCQRERSPPFLYVCQHLTPSHHHLWYNSRQVFMRLSLSRFPIPPVHSKLPVGILVWIQYKPRVSAAGSNSIDTHQFNTWGHPGYNTRHHSYCITGPLHYNDSSKSLRIQYWVLSMVCLVIEKYGAITIWGSCCNVSRWPHRTHPKCTHPWRTCLVIEIDMQLLWYEVGPEKGRCW